MVQCVKCIMPLHSPAMPRLDEAGRQAADLCSFVVEMRHVTLEGPAFQDGSDVADVQPLVKTHRWQKP